MEVVACPTSRHLALKLETSFFDKMLQSKSHNKFEVQVAMEMQIAK